MNTVTSKMNVSTPVIGQLARQAAILVKEIGYRGQPQEGMLPVEQQQKRFKGWAVTGWDPPPEPTGIPGL